jgi:uncharacterized cupin superfamily protein
VSDYTIKHVDDMEVPRMLEGGTMKSAGDELTVTAFGMRVGIFPPNWEHYPHHLDTEQEEVYVTLAGEGQIELDGERHPIGPDVIVRVGKDVRHKIWPGGEEMRVVALGGVPGKAWADAQGFASSQVVGDGADPVTSPSGDWTIKPIDQMEAIYGGGFKRARAELGVTSFGMQVLDLPPNTDLYPEHTDSEQEEIFVPLLGSGEIELDGERHPIGPGAMVRVGTGVRRKIWPGDDGMRVLALGAVPGRAFEPAPVTELGGPAGFQGN